MLTEFSIVGSGFGGGILADTLAGRGKKILLIERGGCLFSTHLLNTARPSYSRGKANSVEGNETVYDVVKAKVQVSEDSEPYIGGPVYCLGGRSNLWGTWTPMAFDETIGKYFPASINEHLFKKNGYKDAFHLVTNGSQKEVIYPLSPNGQITVEEHDDIVAELNHAIPDSKFSLMPIGAELISPAAYRFPMGAFSTTTALLNRMYAKDSNLTVMMYSEVVQVDIPGIEKGSVIPVKSDAHAEGAEDHHANGLVVRSTKTGELHTIKAGKAEIILSAGAIGTASIALNSGLQFHNRLVGKGLIDHDIWFVRFAQQRQSKWRNPINVKTRVTVGGQSCLMVVTVNSNFFLSGSSASLPISQYFDDGAQLLDPVKGRNKMRAEGFDTIAILFEFSAQLSDENEVLVLPAADPVIRVRRKRDHIEEGVQRDMESLIRKVQSIYLCNSQPSGGEDPQEPRMPIELPTPPRPQLLGFGVFAHECGTMRMDSPSKPDVPGVVDENLKVKGFSNLRVCDLSVFPVSTEANPALTLTALALRLADELAPRTPGEAPTHPSTENDIDGANKT